ncbi:hypothetical protein L6164_030274 [Bauhinia variegata]|uniref:Uncharacterized protein n=1 Tax=Bauhinia variegata TaxID=167791 RepID=A0ACB9LC74_BAUVA|nr:hypothetical protein L6164_030274 [Bauhinia variegata]
MILLISLQLATNFQTFDVFNKISQLTRFKQIHTRKEGSLKENKIRKRNCMCYMDTGQEKKILGNNSKMQGINKLMAIRERDVSCNKPREKNKTMKRAESYI